MTSRLADADDDDAPIATWRIHAASRDTSHRGGTNTHSSPSEYQFPSPYQTLASTSSFRFDQYPPKPPGFSNSSLDEDRDMPATRFEALKRTTSREQEEQSFLEHFDERGNGREKQPGKMTVTMKSPRSSDVIEVSPIAPGFSSSRQESDAAYRSGQSTPGGSDYGGSDDEYDWSGEEDLVDQQAKFNEQMGRKVENRKWGVKR